MLAHGFTSDLPSKSLFSKRPRCNSHRLRYRTWQKTVSKTHPSSSTSLLPKAPPFSTKFVDNPTNPPFVFTFKLPEWASTWKVLRSKVSRGYFKKPNARRPNPEFQVLFDSLASDLKNMRISSGSSSHNPSSDTTSKPTSKYFRLLDLPREIRDLIYSFAVINPPADAAAAAAATKHSPPKLTPIHIFYKRAAEHSRIFLSRVDPAIFALFSTNRTIFTEALPIFYRLNQFYLRGVTGPAALQRLDAIAFRNIQHLDVILARSTTLIADLVPVLRALARLPRLRAATIQRAATEPRKDIALRLDLAADAGTCAVCAAGKGGTGTLEFASGLMVLSRNPWLRINLAFYSDKEAGARAVPLSGCAICALAAVVDQRCGPNSEEGEVPTCKAIDIAVSRDGPRGDVLEAPEALTQYPVLLPSLKDMQSIGRFRRRSSAVA